MRKYRNTQEELQRVFCNGCGRQLEVENGYLREGCFHADAVFGYFSRKDGVRHRFDLCEDCYDKMVKAFRIPVEESNEKELL